MLYIYDKENKSLAPCKETEFRKHGILERQDLAKWVEQYPGILGEELLLITTEYDRFDKTNERLDLLGLDKEGNLVIIELKRDDSGKNVDLQAIKYAAYCSTLTLMDVTNMYVHYQKQKGINVTPEEAQKSILEFIENDEFEEINDRPRIILVAKEFRPEVTASVLWLRKFSLDISCVKWDPYEMESGKMVISSSVLIPLPEAKDYIIQAEKKDVVEHTKSLTHTEYLKFYSQCIEQLKKNYQFEYSPPAPKNLYQIPTGISGVHFEWAFHGRPRSSFGVELHFEKGNKDANQKLFSVFWAQRDKLEKLVNEKVIYLPDWGKNWSRLYIEKPTGEMSDDLINWAVEKMTYFIQILQPELDKAKVS
jgi:hypothetical protein